MYEENGLNAPSTAGENYPPAAVSKKINKKHLLIAAIVAVIAVVVLVLVFTGPASMEEVACMAVKAVYERDREAMRPCMIPEYYERAKVGMTEDISGGLRVSSTRVVRISERDPWEYDERVRNFFNIDLDTYVEEAYNVTVEVCYIDRYGHEQIGDPTVEMAKIDGQWYAFKMH